MSMIEVDPQETSRADAFRMWMGAPMPMVTLIRTTDVTRLVRISRRKGLKFNMLMCWCIERAASQMDGAHAARFLDGLQREVECVFRRH